MRRKQIYELKINNNKAKTWIVLYFSKNERTVDFDGVFFKGQLRREKRKVLVCL